jgi:hypothetical protein
MSDLERLIERVEKATGPDEALDADILSALGWHCRHGNGPWQDPDGVVWRCFLNDKVPVTSSLDAVVALIEREMQWADWDVSRTVTDEGPRFVAEVGGETQVWHRPTAPIALLAAFLRARLAQEKKI